MFTAFLILKNGTKVKLGTKKNLKKLKESTSSLKSGMKKRGFIFLRIGNNEFCESILWKEVKKTEFKEDKKDVKAITALF